MIRFLCLTLFLVLGLLPVRAEEQTDGLKILVTFADPGMQHAASGGRSGPGYRRRSSTYLPSVTVKAAAKRIATEFKLDVVDEWPIASLSVHCLVYSLPEGMSAEDLLTKLRQRPEVDSAQLLNKFYVSGGTALESDDPYLRLQHVVDTLELKQAHNWSVGDGAHVTIIDTGADLEHPELRSQIAEHRDFVDQGSRIFASDAHGTAIAGIIVAAPGNGIGMIGVAPAASVSVLKACWYTQEEPFAVCDSFTLAQALGHAIESGTDIVNLSLGGPEDALLERLVLEAIKRGIVVVAAVPVDAGQLFPSAIAGVLAVRSQEIPAPADHSRFPISAPGDDILVLTPRGGYDFASGSSLAAAHVSGIAALLVASAPGLDSQQAGSLLARSRPAAGTSVNACRALAELLARTGCRDGEYAPPSLTQSVTPD